MLSAGRLRNYQTSCRRWSIPCNGRLPETCSWDDPCPCPEPGPSMPVRMTFSVHPWEEQQRRAVQEQAWRLAVPQLHLPRVPQLKAQKQMRFSQYPPLNRVHPADVISTSRCRKPGCNVITHQVGIPKY